MNKTVIGYVLIGLGAFFAVVGLSDTTGSLAKTGVLGTLFLGGPGLFLAVKGRESDEKTRRLVDCYLQLSKDGTPTMTDLQRKTSLAPNQVIKYKLLAEKRGLLPYGSDLS